MSRRLRLGLVVLLAVALLGAFQMTRSLAPASADAPSGNPLRAGDLGADGRSEVETVRVGLLRTDRSDSENTGRNPFRFAEREAPPRREAAPALREPVSITPVTPQGPPPIPLKFIGVLDAPVRIGRVAILSDSRGDVFYGKEGDIIDGRYQVVRIGEESADLAYTDGRGRQTLRLSGQ